MSNFQSGIMFMVKVHSGLMQRNKKYKSSLKRHHLKRGCGWGTKIYTWCVWHSGGFNSQLNLCWWGGLGMLSTVNPIQWCLNIEKDAATVFVFPVWLNLLYHRKFPLLSPPIMADYGIRATIIAEAADRFHVFQVWLISENAGGSILLSSHAHFPHLCPSHTHPLSCVQNRGKSSDKEILHAMILPLAAANCHEQKPWLQLQYLLHPFLRISSQECLVRAHLYLRH